MIEVSLVAGLAVFYCINLALGIYQGRNVRTSSVYVFGNRYSTGVLLLTLTGTVIGANYVTHYFRGSSFYGGASVLLFLAGFCLGSLFVTYYLFPKLREFKDWYTLGDIARQAYKSRYAQLVVEGISIFSSVVLLSAQLIALNRIGTLLGIGKDSAIAPYLLLITFSLVVIAYASRAGTPGVVSTDVLQMVLIFGVMSFITYKVLNLNLGQVHIQGIGDLWHQVKLQYGKNPFTSFPKHPSFKRMVLDNILPTTTLLLFSPAFIQRIGMARDNRQLKRSMVGFITLFCLFMLMILVVGWGLYIIHGGLMAYDEVHAILFKVVSDQLWMKMMLLIMIVAAIMSTADSILTAASVCLVRMLASLQTTNQEMAKPNISSLRRANVMVGLFALLLALLFMHQPVINFIAFVTALLACLLPCLIGIGLGIKRSEKALLRSMACFGLFFIGSIIVGQVVDFSFIEPRWTDPTFPLRLKYTTLLPFVVLLTLLSYVLFEIMVHKGLKWQERAQFTNAKPGAIKRGWFEIKSFFRNPKLWAEEKVDIYESRGVLLFLFCIGTFLTSQFGSLPLEPTYLKSMTVLMLLVFTLCTFNLFPEYWLQKLRGYYPLYWLVSLLVCIPFASLLRWLYHPTSLNALYLILVPIVIHGFAGRKLGILLSLLGYSVSWLFYQLTVDASLALAYDQTTIACLVFTTLLTWILLGHHMQRTLKQSRRPKLWASSWGHDFAHLFMEMQMEMVTEYNPLPKEEKERLNETEKRLQVIGKHIQNAVKQSEGFRQLIVQDSIRDSEIETLPMNQVVNKVLDTFHTDFKELVHVTGKAPIKVRVFMPIFTSVLTNLVRNAWKAGAKKVDLYWDDQSPILYIKDNGPGIAEDKIATLFEPQSSRDGKGLGLPFVKEALAKMGALIDVRSSDQGTKFMILFEQEVFKKP